MTTAAPPAPMTRRDFITQRRRRSATWRFIHALGSLKLALLLLATIALACAIATFAESRFDTRVAQAYIYRAPWFLVWLGVLCANLFAVTLTRWPWQRQHLGFVVTHYGIITLLAGAIIGSRLGFEGNVTLHRGAPPTDCITTSRSLLQIRNPASPDGLVAPFDAALVRPTESRPRAFSVPGSDLRLVVDAQDENLGWTQRLVPDASPAAQPGITMNFDTRMMGQHLVMPFTLIEGTEMKRDFAGLATTVFAPALPAPGRNLIAESQIVFAKFRPVVQSESDVATGVRLSLDAAGKKLTVLLPNEKTVDLDPAAILRQPQKIGPASLTVLEYWPDFVLVNGKPATASPLPNNPAVLVRVLAPHPPRDGEDLRPRLTIAPAADGIVYQLSRGDTELSRGSAKVGGTFPLGWADWRATLVESLPRARLESRRTPAGNAGPPGEPGFRAHLLAPDGRSGASAWVASGETVRLTLDGSAMQISYGLESRPVPFEMRLKSFEVPRLEGTETPANFIATVEFRDAKGGPWREDVAQMNQPASWPGGAFALATGLNYKFSQASWNPRDLGETTLQVLYDPGWLFKWTGSLAICAGIFTMFYLRPKKS